MTTRELVNALEWSLAHLEHVDDDVFRAGLRKATEVLASGKRYLESDRRFREAQALVESWDRDKESARVIVGKEIEP